MLPQEEGNAPATRHNLGRPPLAFSLLHVHLGTMSAAMAHTMCHAGRIQRGALWNPFWGVCPLFGSPPCIDLQPQQQQMTQPRTSNHIGTHHHQNDVGWVP